MDAGINALGTTARYGWGAENVLQMRVTVLLHILSNFKLKNYEKLLQYFVVLDYILSESLIPDRKTLKIVFRL